MNNQIKVELQEWFGSDKSIATSAWTSSTTAQGMNLRTNEDIIRIINMLADSGHSTPFESVILRFWMKIPIQTDRQIVTHRIASHSGMSGRYRTMPSEFLETPEDISKILKTVELNTYKDVYSKHCKESNELYQLMLENLKAAKLFSQITDKEYKRCREFFRGILPQNNMTERVTIFNLRSFSNFIRLRSSEHAQPEIQIVANEMLRLVKETNVCPVAIEALEKNKWVI